MPGDNGIHVQRSVSYAEGLGFNNNTVHNIIFATFSILVFSEL